MLINCARLMMSQDNNQVRMFLEKLILKLSTKEELIMGYSAMGTVKCDKQMANAYILYMVGGSLFDKARLTNPIIEVSLRNQYRELAKDKQERQEIYTENMLRQSVGECMAVLGQMKSDIHVRKQDGYYLFWFRTGFEEIIAVVDRDGRINISRAYHLSDAKWRRLHIKFFYSYPD